MRTRKTVWRSAGALRAGVDWRLIMRRIAAALPDIGIAAAFVWVAANPGMWEAGAGTALWRAALMEFWAIHAAGFLMVPWIVADWEVGRRVVYVSGLVAAYSLVLGVASVVIGAWWPIVTFWALTGNRALDAVLREAPSHRELGEEARPWAGNIAIFVAIAVIVGMFGAGRRDVFIAGAVYYLGNAASELAGWWWVRRWLG